MKKFLPVSALLLMAPVASTVAAEETETPQGEPAEAAANAVRKASPSAAFTALPLCRRVEGTVEICRPGGAWSAVEEGRFYPLGSSFRTGSNGSAMIAFGPESVVSLAADSEIGTRAQPLGVASRTVVVVRGTVEFKLADNLPEGAFFVTAPGFTVKNPAGSSKIVYADKGDGDSVTVRCITGSLGIEGRHFDIPTMRSANEVVIRTSHDHLSTFLYGTSGDYVVKLDQGLRTREDIDENGEKKTVSEKGTLEWHLSPATKVLISRSVPALGERMSVHTMAFDAAGERKSECYFCEGRAEINSGELVAKEKIDSEELAKRAAEATETTAATDVEDAPASENKTEAASEGTNN